MCPLGGQEREFRMRTGTTVRYVSKTDGYVLQERSKKRKKKEKEIKKRWEIKTNEFIKYME